MAYSELIKNFSKIRSYMRDFYVYGFKSREEFTQKSSRSYDDERRRVASWLDEYMQFHQDKEGKQVFLSIDSRQIVHNPFYQAWKAKSFTPGDITLHFYLMVILSQQSRLNLSEIMDELDEILQQFPNTRLFDESTIRKKLKEYVAEGLVLQQKQGRKMYYTLAPIDSLPQTEFLDLFGPRYYYGVGAPEVSIDVAQKELLNTIWEQLPNYETTEDTLAVIDTSGSMYFSYKKPIPASVALSLGLYFAQHNQGAFRNHFIEFSRKPQLIEIKGKTFMDQLEYLATFNEVANTNLEGVFDLILQTALEYELPQTALPAKLLIISDMEFDACVDNHEVTNFERAKQKFASFGYTLPKIIFWNVASRNNQQPVTQNEAGVYLVSGVTPKIFELVVSDALNPYQFMLEVVESPRYQPITA